AARADGRDGVPPRRAADGLDDAVDPAGKTCAGLEGRRTEGRGTLALGGGTARREDLETRGDAEDDRGRRDTAARPLDEHGVAGPQVARPEREAVRGEPRGRQARGDREVEAVGHVEEVRGRDGLLLRERPRVTLGEQ